MPVRRGGRAQVAQSPAWCFAGDNSGRLTFRSCTFASRLWWPNGYGEPNLYTLTIAVSEGSSLGEVGAGAGTASDTKTLRFGIRQLTYELSLFDHAGPAPPGGSRSYGGDVRSERLVDVPSRGDQENTRGWAASLTRR